MRPWIFGIALATAFAAHAQQPAAEAPAPVYSVVEPKVPPKPKPKARAKAKAKAKTAGDRMAQASVGPRAEPQLKRSGPCVVKPVMSDQDLVNCGATPPRY
jgi:hypothetical protein